MTPVRLLAGGLVTAAQAGAARAQRLGGAASGDVSLVRVFLALLVCLVLAGLAILLVRQRLGGRGLAFLPRLAAAPSRLRLVESRRVSPQAELSLVECDGVEYLLLVSSSGPLLLSERPAPGPED